MKKGLEPGRPGRRGTSPIGKESAGSLPLVKERTAQVTRGEEEPRKIKNTFTSMKKKLRYPHVVTQDTYGRHLAGLWQEAALHPRAATFQQQTRRKEAGETIPISLGGNIMGHRRKDQLT